jgi:TolB-like protein/tetratricopeptide (TPR) repeat protein
MIASGTRLGPYEILAPLGAGGMGEVYRAKDTRLGRDVAVKVLPDAFAKDPDRLNRFEREAKAVASLSHPNILAIFDYGTGTGTTYAVTELLEGMTLRDRLAAGPILPKEAVGLAIQMTRGLAAAHGKGIVHRDIKPENLFLTRDGVLKILDFGLSRSTAPSSHEDGPTQSHMTSPGTIMGTVGYMSPEQVRGHKADHRSDLFSAGAILAEMLTGRRPFQRDSAVETMSAILKDDPLRGSAAGLPAALDRIVRRLLEKRPEDRFQSALDAAFALEALSGPSAAPEEEGAPRSIAVLPFADMSPGKDQDYFCEGLAEELIHALTKIPELRVASRTASFQFRARAADLASMAEQMHVTTVLEGSVRKAGERLRVSVQLVNAADGFHLWSERYDRDMSDVFAIQDDITEQVVKALRLVLTEKERSAMARPKTSSVEAYDLYLRGRHLFYKAGREAQHEAIKLFEQAAAIDPGYAPAYAGMADASCFLYMFHRSLPEDRERAEWASLKALELAPHLAECHASRGFVASLSKRMDEAEREFKTSLALDPRLFEAKYFYGRVCMAQGRVEEALRLWEEACEIRPEDYAVPLLLTGQYRGLGREDEARRAAHRGIEAAEVYMKVNPEDPRPLYLGAAGLVILGETEKGLQWAARAHDMAPDDDSVLYNLTCVYSVGGQTEKALDCLEQTVRAGFTGRDWLEHDADLDAIRHTERFKAILAEMRTG